MKFALLTLPAILLFTACTQPDPNEGWELYGDYITATDFVALDEVIDEFSEEEEKTMKIGGTLKQVCQSKGCWTTLETQDGRALRMTFANYSFFRTHRCGGSGNRGGRTCLQKSDFRERASPLCRRCQRTGRGNCGHYRT